MKPTSILVVLIILLLGFFSFTTTPFTGYAVTEDITIDSSYCKWRGKNFEACVYVDWTRVPSQLEGNYAKVFYSTGKSLSEAAPITDRSFLSCDNVGTHEGTRNAHVSIFDRNNNLIRFKKDITINCAKPKTSREVYTDYVNLALGPENFRDDRHVEETVSFTLPKEPVSCELEGEWKVNEKTYAIIGRQSGYCHGAKGTFYSYVDAETQYTVNDAELFRWGLGDLPAYDPPAERHDGDVLHLFMCDTQYYRPTVGRRYGATMKVTTFGKQLVMDWTWDNENRLSTVDVFFDITCTLAPDVTQQKKVSFPDSIPVPPSIEAPPEEIDTFTLPPEELASPEPQERAPQTPWGKFKAWITAVFL